MKSSYEFSREILIQFFGQDEHNFRKIIVFRDITHRSVTQNVLVAGFCLRLQVKRNQLDPVPISGYQHQHKIIYINQAQHKPSARVKTNIRNSKQIWPSTYVPALFHGYCC
jgi:hypothetical protein